MEDILQSIKAYLYDRATSPLIGAFVVSWILWNYRVIVILFSGATFALKFSSIDRYMASTAFTIPWLDIAASDCWARGVIFPLLTALAYIYLYPFAAEPVYKYSLEKQKIILKLKKEANDSRIIDEKESRKLFKDLADLQGKYDDDIGQYQKQVKSLKEMLDEKTRTNTDAITPSQMSDQELQERINELLEKDSSDDDNGMNDNDVLVLKTFHEYSDRSFTAAQIRNISNAKISDVYSSFKKLEKLGFIRKSHMTDTSEQAYKITNSGHEYLGTNEHLDY